MCRCSSRNLFSLLLVWGIDWMKWLLLEHHYAKTVPMVLDYQQQYIWWWWFDPMFHFVLTIVEQEIHDLNEKTIQKTVQKFLKPKKISPHLSISSLIEIRFWHIVFWSFVWWCTWHNIVNYYGWCRVCIVESIHLITDITLRSIPWKILYFFPESTFPPI